MSSSWIKARSVRAAALLAGLAVLVPAAAAPALDFDKALREAGKVQSQGPVTSTDSNAYGASNRLQSDFVSEDMERRARLNAYTAQEEANRRASVGGGGPCRSGDVCFNVVRAERDYTEIVCTKGQDYNIGQKKRICGSGEKWGGCGMSDAFAHHHTMTKAGTMQCD